MPKRVRIEGDPDVYEVIAETPFMKLLVNRAARYRRDIATLEEQLAHASERLADAKLEESGDVL